MGLETLWFMVVVILLIGYAILDGFDLGVGMLHLFSKSDTERRLMLNSIGPVWDGNEVWLVTAGGAIFAGFPHVYATLFSAFYSPTFLLLSGLIFRAVAIEFRSKRPMAWWRWTWDVLFSLASLLIAFALGVAIGTLIQGFPLDENKEFSGDYTLFFTFYTLLVGVMAVALFAMHGAIYIVMKTEGPLHDKIKARIYPAVIFFIVTYAITTVATLIYQDHMADAMRERPLFFVVAIINLLAVANIPREINRGNDKLAFLSSSVNIACLLTLYAIGTYPNIIRAVNDPANLSITVENGASSPLTLSILLLMAIIGIPLVAAYTITIYWIFRGKVRLETASY